MAEVDKHMIRNHTVMKEFILLGFPNLCEYRTGVFVAFFATYLLTLTGNIVIIAVSWSDSRLHTPMYFFLCNFSMMEILVTTTVVPRMLVDLVSTHNTISLAGCLTQSYLYFSLGSTEFLILTAMALDRYVAICLPLRYATIMSSRVCSWLIVGSWLTGFLSIISPTIQKTHLNFCREKVINHFFCDSAPLLKLSCSETRHIEVTDFFLSLLFVVTTLLLIILSYFFIIVAVLKISSSDGRQKAFSTCASHITLVAIGYGSTIFIYVRPNKSQASDVNKVVALIIFLVTPFLNPFIWTLRNEKFKEAFRDFLKRIKSFL